MQNHLIRHAELLDGRIADIRIHNGKITEIGTCIPNPTEHVMDARGGLLIPGLHDHHVHIAATAAAMASVRCGPPEVHDEAALAKILNAPGQDWLRGIGYHESVTGALIDRAWLDKLALGRPIRIQHRSGRLWIFNSTGLDRLLANNSPPPPGLDRATGHLFDEDTWLRQALGGTMPSFSPIGSLLSRYGIAGITDIRSPANDDAIAAHFAEQHRAGTLPQRIHFAGKQALRAGGATITRGPLKIHLHEANLPDYDETVATIRTTHATNRPIAVHCVTEVELVFTLAAIREAGTIPGDRIEHASITPDPLVEQIANLELIVCVQPNFVAQRGDVYRNDIPEPEWKNLYRLRAFRNAGVPLIGGSDTPYGAADPWAAMQAATIRRTAQGQTLGESEALTPEEALGLFLAGPADLTRARGIEPGAPADLCLLQKPWPEARKNLSAGLVRATFINGTLVHNRID